MFPFHSRVVAGLLSALLFLPGPAQPAEITVAVAANFLRTLQTLEPMFESATGHELRAAAGSTGSLYAQIANGAPYDVFLAADAIRPARAIAEGFAVAGSETVYAIGTLVLYARDPDRVTGPQALNGDFHHLAIANSETAPYGTAAREVLIALGRWQGLQPRIARAQSVAGAYAAVVSGAADLGFVALSSLQQDKLSGSRWLPPRELYTPLRQTAVVLSRAAAEPAAREFLAFLATDAARSTIRAAGYEVE